MLLNIAERKHYCSGRCHVVVLARKTRNEEFHLWYFLDSFSSAMIWVTVEVAWASGWSSLITWNKLNPIRYNQPPTSCFSVLSHMTRQFLFAAIRHEGNKMEPGLWVILSSNWILIFPVTFLCVCVCVYLCPISYQVRLVISPQMLNYALNIILNFTSN